MSTLYTQEQTTKMMIVYKNREAREEGQAEGKCEILLHYMKRHNCDAETAMDELDIEAGERIKLRPKIAEHLP